jgi:hypothetical protein
MLNSDYFRSSLYLETQWTVYMGVFCAAKGYIIMHIGEFCATKG